MYKPKMTVSVRGYEIEMYTIGYTARLLRISTETIRAWERDGICPKPMFTYKNGVRLYHPLEVEAIAKVLRKKHFRGTYAKKEKLKLNLWAELGSARKEILARLDNDTAQEENLPS
jgi:DNA-binding transcriptional MerR regulator